MLLSSESNLTQNGAVTVQSHPHCDIRTSFAKAFRTWRKRKKIPLKRVAHDLGIAVSTVNSWELGERFPTGRHFEMLADYTGEPPCRLFCSLAHQCARAYCRVPLAKES